MAVSLIGARLRDVLTSFLTRVRTIRIGLPQQVQWGFLRVSGFVQPYGQEGRARSRPPLTSTLGSTTYLNVELDLYYAHAYSNRYRRIHEAVRLRAYPARRGHMG